MKTYLSTVLFATMSLAGCGGADSRGAATEVTAGCPAEWTAPPAADPSIALPADGGAVLLHTLALGTQNYICAASDAPGGTTTYGWTLVAPAATLQDCAGAVVGMHSAPTGAAAPQWSNQDGSVIVGHRVAGFTPDTDAIPWLLLAASSHSGTGIMTGVGYVQRVNTHGGKAAADGCDAAHVGATSDVPYSADYYFFGVAGQGT